MGGGAAPLWALPASWLCPREYQRQLPPSGAPVVAPPSSDRAVELYDDYVRRRTLQDWRFWLVSTTQFEPRAGARALSSGPRGADWVGVNALQVEGPVLMPFKAKHGSGGGDKHWHWGGIEGAMGQRLPLSGGRSSMQQWGYRGQSQLLGGPPRAFGACRRCISLTRVAEVQRDHQAAF